MDRKAILVLAVSFGLLMLWYPLVNRLFPPQPAPVATSSASATNAPTRPAGDTNAPGVTSPTTPTPTPISPAAPAVDAPAFARPAGPPVRLTLATETARFTFTSHGGGLEGVELLKYPETVGRRARRGVSSNGVATLNADAPVPAFTLLGDPGQLGDHAFTLTNLGGVVRAEKRLPNGLLLVKEFQPGSNYLLTATVRFENPGTEPRALPPQELVVGTSTPMSGQDPGTLQRVMWFDGNRADSVAGTWFNNAPAWGCGCVPGTPRFTYAAAQTNIVWASAQNQFFALVTIPRTNTPAHQLVVRHLRLPPPPAAALQEDRQLNAKPYAMQAALAYPEVVLAPGQTLERRFDLFAGPKEYRTLDRLGARFGNRVDLVMDFGFWGFFSKALLLSMNALHGLGLSYGLAIIAITIIIKLLFWPLTQASTRSMKRMQLLGPKMKEIQEKYKDDPKKMNERTMAFMREHKINPAAGCLPILIQIPVFMGFYFMLQSAIELRGARFLWAADLSQPDTILVLFGFPVNPLPIVMGLTQLWQMRLTPPSPGMDPVQQKMLQYMPLIFLFILYNFSSGLTLYWTVQNLLTIAQMKLTKSTGEPAATPAPARRKH